MKYLVGTMIEIPRAALTAGQIAKEAEFFSFGTNDLTQMTSASPGTTPPSSWMPTTITRSMSPIPSSTWTGTAWAS